MYRLVCTLFLAGSLLLMSAVALAAESGAQRSRVSGKYHAKTQVRGKGESRHGRFGPGPWRRSDHWGYFCLDQAQPGGPTYNWIDTVGAVNTGISGDDVRGLVDLPFTFNFYGVDYTTLWVCTNGWASFGPDPGTNEYENRSVPHAEPPNQALFPLWDDLITPPGFIYKKTVGVPPNRKFAVIWSNVEYIEESGGISFELVLNEADQSILFQYADAYGDGDAQSNGSSATVGIESQVDLPDRQTAIDYELENCDYLVDSGVAIRFWTPPTRANDMAILTLDYVPEFVRIGDSAEIWADARNFGTATRDSGVAVKLSITGPVGYSYEDVDQTTHDRLGHGWGSEVKFAPSWVPPGVAGDYWLTAWTELAGDEDRSNDTMCCRLRVVDFYEPFSDTGFPPSGWTRGRFAGTADWGRNEYEGRTDWGEAYFASNSAGCKAWLMTPRLDLTRFSSDSVVFWMLHCPVAGYAEDTLVVQVSTDSGVSWLSLDSLAGPLLVWRRCAYDLEALTQTDKCFVRFTGISVADEIDIDDVSGPPRFRPDHDVGVKQIIVPSAFQKPQTLVPVAEVVNDGLNTEGPFQVMMRIPGTGYERTAEVSALQPYATKKVEFPPCTPDFDSFQAKCSTMLSSDRVAVNDFAVKSFKVLRYYEQFETDSGDYYDGHSAPNCRWHWNDYFRCWLPGWWADNVVLRLYSCHFLATASSPVLYFRQKLDSWLGRVGGNVRYSTDGETWTLLENPVPPYTGPVAGLGGQPGYSGRTDWDTVSVAVPVEAGQVFQICWDFGADASGCGGNGWYVDDVAGVDFRRWIAGAEGWEEVRAVPAGVKPPKDGAWLTVGPGPAGDPVVFGAKGNKTNEFYHYEPFGDTWYQLDTIPRGEGSKMKPPGKGCVGVSDGANSVYMVKGNNTLGFWRYDVAGAFWEPLTGVPMDETKKKVKGGGDMVYVDRHDSGFVYLLKGGKAEFYRYSVRAAKWDTLKNAPSTPDRKKYGSGSFMVYDGADAVYAHQARYNDKIQHYMYRYNLLTQDWQTMPLKGMPLTGLQGGKLKSKKSRDGGCGTWFDGSIYALKGGGTQGFYRYFPQGDSWHELDTLPSSGSVGSRKFVKAGADIVSYGDGVFFALKGSKTYEFWRSLVTPQATSCTPQASGVQTSGVERGAYGAMHIFPTPVADGLAVVRLALSQAGPVSLTVFDVTGRAVLHRECYVGRPASGVALDLRSLPGGVYLVRLDAGGLTATQKLLMQR